MILHCSSWDLPLNASISRLPSREKAYGSFLPASRQRSLIIYPFPFSGSSHHVPGCEGGKIDFSHPSEAAPKGAPDLLL